MKWETYGDVVVEQVLFDMLAKLNLLNVRAGMVLTVRLFEYCSVRLRPQEVSFN